MTALYVAGPMTGRPRWNFDAFEEATNDLRAAGFTVWSPHEYDLEQGFDPDAPVEAFTRDDLKAALRRDLEAVLDVDGIATLEGYEFSKGARAEVALAFAVSTPVRSVDEWRHMAEEGRA